MSSGVFLKRALMPIKMLCLAADVNTTHVEFAAGVVKCGSLLGQVAGIFPAFCGSGDCPVLQAAARALPLRMCFTIQTS